MDMIEQHRQILELLAKIKERKHKIFSGTLNDHDTQLIQDDIKEYTKEINKLLRPNTNDEPRSHTS